MLISAIDQHPEYRNDPPEQHVHRWTYISSNIDKGRGVGTVSLIMKRNNGRIERQFQFESNDEDFELMKLMRGQSSKDEGCNVVI